MKVSLFLQNNLRINLEGSKFRLAKNHGSIVKCPMEAAAARQKSHKAQLSWYSAGLVIERLRNLGSIPDDVLKKDS